jgi:membrane fusion protein (multidrug efflux system)
MLLRLLLVTLLLAAVLGGIFGWKQIQMQRQAAMSGPPPPPVVAAAEVEQEDWRPRLSAVGSLVAAQGIFVTNEVAGQVRELFFESGESVEKGDRLVQLDDSVDQADLRGLIAQRDLADIKVGRFGKLLKDRSASQSDYDEASAELDSAKAAVAAKEALIAKKHISAPFSGRLGIRITDLGEFLAPGSRIVPLDALEPIFADYSLPERHLPRIQVGEQVLVRVAAYPDEEFEGVIMAINPGVDEKTRAVRIRAILQNKEHLLRPGMFAEVDTLLPARERLLTLPRTAITFAPYGDTVFLINEQDGRTTVERRQVNAGQAQGGRVEILGGLEAGDRVVIGGQIKLRNGQQVTVDNSVVPPRDGPLEP